jgi:hypothetical protein
MTFFDPFTNQEPNCLVQYDASEIRQATRGKKQELRSKKRNARCTEAYVKYQTHGVSRPEAKSRYVRQLIKRDPRATRAHPSQALPNDLGPGHLRLAAR